MKPFDWLAFAAYAVAAVVNVAAFATTGDLNNLIIAGLLGAVAIWHRNSIRAGRLIDDYANLVDQLTTELEKWTPIARHEATFADVPKVSSGPLRDVRWVMAQWDAVMGGAQ